MEQYYPIRKENAPIHLKPGKSACLVFDGSAVGSDADRLHFTGETAQFYQWKNEPDHPMLYRRIDDSLNTEFAEQNQYCLDLSADDYAYPILAFHKVMFPPKLSYLRLNSYGDCWTMGLRIRTENLKISEGGYLRFRAEVRYRKEDTDLRSVLGEGDVLFDLPIPEGTRGWTDLSAEIHFDARNTANICFFLEGEHYAGKVYAEAPFFTSDSGWNLLPDFAPESANRPQFTWTGWNLSKKEWPAFEFALNGQVFYRGAIFERCHRRSEGEIPLNGAAILPGENRLTVTNISDYRDPLAYDLYDVAFLAWEDPFPVACPKIVTAGKPFAVFVEGHRGDRVECDSDTVGPVDLVLEEEGLNAILLRCDKPRNNLSFTLTYGEKRGVCRIERCVLREEDKVTTGTGDMIYVPVEEEPLNNFLKWYFENQIGNLVTIRPTYRWSGSRIPREDLWKKTARLLSKAGICYAHMADGRELPGCDGNPSPEAMAGEGFLGRQNHEFDGAVSYWGLWEYTQNPGEEAYQNLRQRRFKTHGHTMCPLRGDPDFVVEKQGRRILFRDLTVPEDMEAMATDTVSRLSKTKNGATRHTGPSSLFKYFYRAGYEWTGAELMYGPQEIVCAALRGAAKAYEKPIVGAHHAIQWSTTPHDSLEKNLRYRLALYGTYLQGVHDINTEEGLWHVEEYYTGYNRFSDCCLNHKKEQQEFYRYVQTHGRTGEFRTPIAFLHGRYDGWDVFTRGTVWGRTHIPRAEAEEAWDLLTYFYPRNVLTSLYRHPCPKESVGYYTGTPYGNVDILPIEQGHYEDYAFLIAIGYNKATAEDAEKLQHFVQQGGTLLLGWPQWAETTLRTDVVALNHTYLNHPFLRRILPEAVFAEDTYRGKPVTVGASPLPEGASVLLTTDNGRPLSYGLSVGTGEVLVLNAKQYAGAPAVGEACTALLDRTVPAVLAREAVYGRGDRDVQFAVFRQTDGSHHVYFMATDWYNDDPMPRRGTLTVGEHCYEIAAPMGIPVKAVVNGTIAAWSHDRENDVVRVEKDTITVQGMGTAVFTVAKGGKTTEIPVEFGNDAVKIIPLPF